MNEMLEEFFTQVHSFPEFNSKLKLLDIDLTKKSSPEDILLEIKKIVHLWVEGSYCVWNICHAPKDYSPDYPIIDVSHVRMNDDEIEILRWKIECVSDFVNSKEYQSFKLYNEIKAELNTNNNKDRKIHIP